MPKTMIAMSGGVDSSAAARLIKDMGHDICGAIMTLYGDNSKDIKDAEAVAQRLGMPFYVFDFHNEFKKYVVDDFVSSYCSALTPNPCVVCNKHIKFGAFLDRARELGCDFVATGHYAKTEYDKERGRYIIKKADDLSKDQSYVLYSLTQDQLKSVILPLGSYTKDRSREIAKNSGFENAGRSDSQDICFIPNGEYASFIKEHCPKDVDNKLYFDLVQAQMNTDELYLTCINGISNYGRKKLRPLLNESSFLENLAIDENESIRRLVYFYYPKTQHKNPNGKRKNVILVAGTEGTEKGFLSKMLFAEQLPARITSVTGMLIRANCDPLNLKNNQHKLKVFMDKTLDPDDIYVISCNFCQLYPDGTNETLSLSVYEDLNPIAVVFLQTSIENMIQSVRYDNKIILDETTAELYLQNEETASSDYADLKDIPIFKYDVSDMPKAAEKIRSLVEKYS